MKTFIYMVRHGDSPKDGNERTRELTEKGRLDARRITDILQKEGIDTVISSPYSRSIQTVQEVANQIEKEVIIFEDLKEQLFIAGDKRISDEELFPFLQKSFSDPTYALEGGESNADCQKRAIKILEEIVNVYPGQKVVIGTHGAVMTLMMGFYDSRYDLNFLLQTTKPDIYRMEFNGQELVDVKRLWEI
ncbi:histidine phosphatase family protein [Lysinibacillus sp. KCTC 33748]|uniref:histidine phosphatase family protein n=1 Tax=unclassified Lysinibacillus TaxID=2636778 RepID=UPI0009A659E2|nr:MULTISPECIES: histidine phosphatase family protein [unclassified Lysinibacillus]OXS68490.1 histidine phosphatase family protein [Lysinibacillus sp. KCTC 33748]SKC10194.1 2,3-bisphosphoglycerate-dependent phosphoglycerate mutase [Lysinibacillus sp. AC-3]